MKLYHIQKGEMPPADTYILIHYKIPQGNISWEVAKCYYGISETERKKMSAKNNPRAKIYRDEDEHGNNATPYIFKNTASHKIYGNDIDYWCELPEIKKE